MDRAPTLLLAGVLLATTFAYHGSAQNGFIWDDSYTIVNNRAIDSLAAFPTWFTKPETWSSRTEASYRPIVTASFGLNIAFWGRSPGAFHLVNLVIHLGVVCLTYVLAFRLTANRWSAVVAAGLFALHPLNAETVNYISARSSSLAAFLTLAAVASWTRATTTPRVSIFWMTAGLLWGILAMGTKETSVVLPLLIMIWDRATSKPAHPWSITLRRSLPWWILSVLYVIGRAVILSDSLVEQPVGDGVWQPFLFALKIWLVSLGSWFVPFSFALDHGWPWTIGAAESVLILVASLVAVTATIALFRIIGSTAWCIVWFWVALLPLAALPWVSRITLYQDHRVYLAGVGLSWLIGDLIRRTLARLPSNRLWMYARGAAVFVVVAMFVRVDSFRTTVWHDDNRLWAHTLRHYPDSVLGRNHQAVKLTLAGELAAARTHLERSVTLAPDFAVTHNYLGVVYARQGDLVRATAEFETAVRLSPLFVNARLNLGNAYERQRRPDLALTAYESDLPDEPWAIDLIERAAVLLARSGRRADAQRRYERILRIDPTDPSARKALAQGRGDTATPENPR